MRVRTTAGFAAAAILAVASSSLPSAAQSPFSRIVVFGQSLSDPGNAFALRGGTNTPPDYVLDPLLVPGAPYARGGHHFSNGATWVEQYARSIGLAGSVRPAYQSSSDATNFAVAGARARDDGSNVNLPDQVDAFLQQAGGVAPPDALYVIEFGGNDIRDAIIAYLGGGPPAAGAVLTDANLAIARAISTLYGAGARRFLVWRAPNVGLTPAIRTLNHASPGAIQLATGLTQLFNAALDGVVAQFAPVPGVRIDRLDAWRVLNDLVADPRCFRAQRRDVALHHSLRGAVHLRNARGVPVLGRHSPHQGGARHHRAGSGDRPALNSRTRTDGRSGGAVAAGDVRKGPKAGQFASRRLSVRGPGSVRSPVPWTRPPAQLTLDDRLSQPSSWSGATRGIT